MIHPIQDQGAHRGQLHVLTIKEFDVEVPLVSVRTIERQQVISVVQDDRFVANHHAFIAHKWKRVGPRLGVIV